MTSLKTLLEGIADAIRSKERTSDDIAAADFAARIAALPQTVVGDVEPSEGDVYALLYVDGLLSIQYGDEAYDVDGHGTRLYSWKVDNEETGYDGSKVLWPWAGHIDEIVLIKLRHHVPFASLAYAFKGAENLVLADMNRLDDSALVHIEGMFYGCGRLAGVLCSGWTLPVLKCAEWAFAYCEHLTCIDTSGWTLKRCTSIAFLFCGCKLLTNVACSKWQTSLVESMSQVFDGCAALESVNCVNWDLASCTSIAGIFSGCESLASINVNKWDVGNVTAFRSAFMGCTSLKAIDLSDWYMHSANSVSRLFYGCKALTSVTLGDLTHPLGSVYGTDMSQMFYLCQKLTTVNLGRFCMLSCEDVSQMFSNCLNLVTLDLTNMHWFSPAKADKMFYYCPKLTTIYVRDDFFTEDVTYHRDCSSEDVFLKCTALVGGNGTAYSADHVDYDYFRVDADGAPGYLSVPSSS